MADKTEHYGLNLPAQADFYNVDEFNENAELIDQALNDLETGKVSKAGAQTKADQAEANAKAASVPLTAKGQANGVATLDGTGKVPAEQLPAMNYDPAGSAAAVDAKLTTHTRDTTTHVTAAEKSDWNSKAAGEHTHTAAQVGARPSNWTPTAAEVGARPSTWMPTSAEVGAVPTSRTVNNKALSADISLTAADVGAAATGHTHTAAQLDTYTKSEIDLKVTGAGYLRGNDGDLFEGKMTRQKPSAIASYGIPLPSGYFGGNFEKVGNAFLYVDFASNLQNQLKNVRYGRQLTVFLPNGNYVATPSGEYVADYLVFGNVVWATTYDNSSTWNIYKITINVQTVAMSKIYTRSDSYLESCIDKRDKKVYFTERNKGECYYFDLVTESTTNFPAAHAHKYSGSYSRENIYVTANWVCIWRRERLSSDEDAYDIYRYIYNKDGVLKYTKRYGNASVTDYRAPDPLGMYELEGGEVIDLLYQGYYSSLICDGIMENGALNTSTYFTTTASLPNSKSFFCWINNHFMCAYPSDSSDGSTTIFCLDMVGKKWDKGTCGFPASIQYNYYFKAVLLDDTLALFTISSTTAPIGWKCSYWNINTNTVTDVSLPNNEKFNETTASTTFRASKSFDGKTVLLTVGSAPTKINQFNAETKTFASEPYASSDTQLVSGTALFEENGILYTSGINTYDVNNYALTGWKKINQ